MDAQQELRRRRALQDARGPARIDVAYAERDRKVRFSFSVTVAF